MFNSSSLVVSCKGTRLCFAGPCLTSKPYTFHPSHAGALHTAALPCVPAACKPLVKKGMAVEIVQLLAPHVTRSNTRVVTNTAYCMSKLLRAEQQLLQKQQEEPDNQEEEEQQQPERLPPVLAAVLAHADISRFASPMGLHHDALFSPGNFYQVGLFHGMQVCTHSACLLDPGHYAIRMPTRATYMATCASLHHHPILAACSTHLALMSLVLTRTAAA